ncbi:MAG: hypothetical protein ABSG43_21285 [Solirubrobacteraceae bacterium]
MAQLATSSVLRTSCIASPINSSGSLHSSARRPIVAIAAFSRSARRCSVTSCSWEMKNGRPRALGVTSTVVTANSTTDPSGRR